MSRFKGDGMNSEGSRKAEVVFARLLDFEQSEQLQMIEELCADDLGVAAEVREMLERLPADSIASVAPPKESPP